MYYVLVDGGTTQPDTALHLKLEDGQFDSVTVSTVDTDEETARAWPWSWPSGCTVDWVQVM